MPYFEVMAKPDTPVTLTPEEFAAISRAVADPRRYAILRQIGTLPSVACTCLEVRDCLSPATISHHLKELQQARLITVEREGRGVRMALQREVWQAYLRHLAELGQP